VFLQAEARLRAADCRRTTVGDRAMRAFERKYAHLYLQSFSPGGIVLRALRKDRRRG